jgi:hypothetical protein
MLKFIENHGTATMYVGNTMIPPGEGKQVEVPDEAARVLAVDTGPNLVELMAQLLEKSVALILPDLSGMTNEALDLAESQERAGKNRKTLIEAIQAERIARADAKLQAEQDAAAGKALEAARAELLSAGVALINLRADSPERAAAQARKDEAQAKVDALTPKE